MFPLSELLQYLEHHYSVTPQYLKIMSAIYSMLPLEYDVLCLLYVSPLSARIFSFRFFIFVGKIRLFKFSLRLFIRPNRSQFADSGNMCMMNWAGTPAAQVLPRVRGDTTRGELSSSAVTYDALLPSALARNSPHLCQRANSPTSASDTISQWFIHNIRTLQGKY